ncbi:MAG: FAD-dependent protein [Pseudomonadota bacterium]
MEKDGVDNYKLAASDHLNIDKDKIEFVKILSKSLDARGKKQFFYEMSIVVNVPDSFVNKDNLPVYTDKIEEDIKQVKLKDRPIIIGFGPAGIFAALELIDRGIKPLIFERGKKIEEREIDIQKLIGDRVLNTESNIQFGEGGAGSYSDGKLFSRIKNSKYADKVLDTFIKFGAPEEIGYLSKPHLGTDVLCKIVIRMRNYILERGGDIHFGSKMTDMLIDDGALVGVVINGEKEYRSSTIYLAVGHSARDTFEIAFKNNIFVEPKPISIGMRLEHPAEIINLIRYGKKYKDFPGIGAASYSFTHTDRKIGRGIYTFCMCPGGEVLNASSEDEMLVVNGMSYSGRSSAFSNSAIVVTCNTADYGSSHPLAGIEFQRDVERKAFRAGGGDWKVPAQNLTDFLAGRVSSELNKNSYKMGTTAADMKEIFPKFVSDALSIAFKKWKNDSPLFVSKHAILLGAETRTSCPVRMRRNEEYESINIKNLYPIGEGSGYAGGITSSAVDAIKAVECSLVKKI